MRKPGSSTWTRIARTTGTSVTFDAHQARHVRLPVARHEHDHRRRFRAGRRWSPAASDARPGNRHAADHVSSPDRARDPADKGAPTHALRSIVPLMALAALLVAVPATAATKTVNAQGFAFVGGSPTIAQGDEVSWDNQGAAHHTSTRSAFPGWIGPTAGQRQPRTFTQAGAFAYRCTIHGSMTGTIKVRIKASPSSGGASTSFTITVGQGNAASAAPTSSSARRRAARSRPGRRRPRGPSRSRARPRAPGRSGRRSSRAAPAQAAATARPPRSRSSRRDHRVGGSGDDGSAAHRLRTGIVAA